MAPLAGIKVLDFSTLLPGPFATMQLADMGAEVLRVESPSRPDLVRSLAPQLAGQSAAFAALNRGKTSLALNLKHPEAKHIIHQLVADYDIVIEQFRPGVMARLGLDYAALSAINQRLIYCSITGYGQTGQMASKAGHDINYLALSGIAHGSGNSAGPALCSMQIADIAAGSQPAVIAILGAVLQRQHTGKGQHIDIAMTQQCLALQPLIMPQVLNSEAQTDVACGEHLLNGGGIYDYFATADGRFMAVGSLEPAFRQALLDTLGHPEWQTLADEALKPRLADQFRQQTQREWMARFAAVDACVEPVLTQTEAVEYWSQQPVIGVSDQGIRQIQPMPLLSAMENAPAAAPRCGEHTQQVLQRLGYSPEKISSLMADGLGC